MSMFGKLTKADKNNELFAYISLLIAVTLYASTFFVMKIALNTYHPITLAMIRFILSSIIFLPFFLIIYRDIKVEKKYLGILWLMIICEPCMYFIFEGNALRLSTSSQIGIVSSFEPILLTLGARIILKERIPKIAYWGFVLALIGAIFLSIGSQITQTAPNPILGNIIEFGAISMTCVSMISTKYLMDKYPPFYLAGVQVLGGALFFTALHFLFGISFPLTFNLATLIVLYLGILTVINYALYNYGMCSLSATKASAFLYILPVMAIFFGWFFLNETLTQTQILAIIVIFFGIYMSQMKSRRVVKVARLIKKKKIK